MKTLTRSLSSLSLILVMAFSARSQDVFKVAPVGIGTITPAQALDVAGNVKFSGALMPGGFSGSAGNMLLSGGVQPASPTWFSNGASGQILVANGTAVPTWTSLNSEAWLFTGNTTGAAYGSYYIGTLNQLPTNLPLEFLASSQSGYVPIGLLDNVNGNVYFGGDVNGGWPGGNSTTALDAASHNVGIGNGALDVANSSGTAVATTGADAGVTNDVFFGYGTGISLYVANSVAIGTASQRNIDGPGFTIGGPNTSMGNFAFRASNANQGFTTTGNHNTAIGNENEYGATTSSYNTSLGDQSMSAISNAGTSYSYNTSLGSYAQYSLTTGTDNTGVGTHALYSTSSSSNNTAAGYYALYSNSTSPSGSNTAIGYEAAYSNTTGHNSTSIGYEANYAYTSVASANGNTAIGSSALSADTHQNSTAIGSNALKSFNAATTPYDVAIGDSAGYANNNYFSTLIGPMAGMEYGQSATGNGQLAAVGYGAVKNLNGNSAQSTGFGWMAASATNTATAAIYSFTAVGPMAMGNGIVTGIGNTAIGAAAMANVGSGGYNVAIGSNNSVTSFTSATLGALTTGSYDVAIGYNAASASNGSSNVAIGINTNVGTTQSYNTAVGYEAAATAGASAATGSTALGDNASATAGNATAIGANAIATTANTLILGGTGANAVSVGIGTSTPAQELEVGGTTNTIRIDGVGSGGSFGNTAPSLSTDQILFARAAGDVYSLPNGSNGQELTITGGVPTWTTPGSYTATSPLTITSNNLLLSGTSGGVLYGTGTGVAFTQAGNPLNILTEDPTSGHPMFDTIIPSSLSSHDEWGSQSVITDSLNSVITSADEEYTISGNGLPGYPLRLAKQGAAIGQVLAFYQGTGYTTWKPSSANASLTTNNIAPVGGSAIAVANGTAQVIGASNVTLDIRGTSGGLLEGNGSGSSATFTPAGTNGYVYTYTGAGASSWQPSTITTPWSLTGNTGTTPVTNWLGTNDDKQFRFYITGQSGSYNGPAGSIDPQFVGATAFANTYLGGPNTNNGNSGGAGNNDAGSYNVAFGFGSLGFATSASTYDVAFGSHALEFNPGSYDVTFGYGVGFSGSSPASNYFTELGSNGNQPPVPGNYSTFVGYATLTGASAGLYNTTLGYASMFGSTSGQSNTAIGARALYNITVSHNTAVGDSALYTNTTGTHNTALGYNANVASLTNATVIGYNASALVGNSITLGNASVVGGTSASPLTSGLYLPGYSITNSLFYTSNANGLVSALTPSTSGYMLQSNGPGNLPAWANVTPGSGAVSSVSSTGTIIVNGTWNINIQGTNANEGGVLYSAGTANDAAFTSTGTAGEFLTSNGTSAPTWAASANALWSLVGNAGIIPGTNYLGTTDDKQFQFYSGSNYAGNAGSLDPQVVGITTYGNTYLGGVNGNNSMGGAGNDDKGSYNVALGFGTMGGAAAAATYDVAMGTGALEAQNHSGLMVASYCVSIGTSSMIQNLSGNYETALGSGAMEGGMYNSATTNYNTAVGRFALSAGSASAIYYHSYNTAYGYYALETPSSGAAGNSTTAVGNYSSYYSTGNRNTGIGDSALLTNTTGASNTALGWFANVASAGLTNATAIGYNAIAPVSNSITLGNTAASKLYIPGYNTTGSLYYTDAAPGGLVGSTGAGTFGYFLESHGPGVAPTWANVATGGGTVTSVIGTAPIIVNGTWNVNIQGTAGDTGSVLYSTGSTPALFLSSPGSAGLALTSSAGGAAPTWAAYTPPASSTWQTTGNSAITPGINFIGTTDANRLCFETDGVTAGTIDLPTTLGGNGNVYYGWETSYYSNYPTVASGTARGDVGTNNTAFGFAALRTPTNSATGNIALGWYDMNDGLILMAGVTVPLSGSYNIGNGYNNLYDLSSGNGNIALSPSGEHGIQTGSYNTALGYFSCTGNVFNGSCVGSFNTDIGYEAQYANPTGSGPEDQRASSTAIGYFSLYSDDLSSRNVAVGSYSLNSLSTGTYDLAVGDSAFFGTALTSTNNSALGCFSNTSLVSMTNTTVVGARAYASTSNEIVLGEISGLNGALANTNVSIGTNAPAADAALAIKTNHLETQAASIATGLSAGYSGVTVSGGGLGLTGTDVAGAVAFSVSTGGSGLQTTINFANTYTYSPIISISPANANAAAAMTTYGAYVTSNTTSFSISFTSAPPAGTYNFNYYAVETPGTSPVTVFPSSYTELCVVPITLTNNQSTATPVGFQQMVTVNSSLYSNEMSGLQNIVFTTAAPVAGVTTGTVLNAWIESGNSSSSASTVYWVNLGAKTIPANSSGTIYMNIISANILSAAGPTGEAPQLSGTYAQYDNGPFVFGALAYTQGNYWNFAGTGNPSGLTKASPNTYGTIGFNNLCTLAMTTTGQWGNYLASSSTITPGSTGIVVETDANNSTPYPTTSANAMLSGLIVGTSATFANTTSYAVTLSNQTTMGSPAAAPASIYNFDVQSGYEQTVFPYPIIGYLSPSNTNYNIYSLGINSSGNLGFGDVNYTNLVQTTPNTTNNLSAGFYIGLGTTQDNSYFQWLRTRIYPPNAVMPSVSAASETCP